MAGLKVVDVGAKKLEAEPAIDAAALRRLKEARDRVLAEVSKSIVGQRAVVEQVLIALLARGHGLLVGVPGLAKTLIVRTIALVLDLDFKRIQFTPDLMPSDITGTEVMEEDPHTKARSFRFVRGPIFASVLLADEINRTPPKTQAALLEAMQEHHVTVAGTSHALPDPFLVLATQNPIEQEGTYPLPEAQLDRFMFLIEVGYPDRTEEVAIVKATTQGTPATPGHVLSRAEILGFQAIVRALPVSDYVLTYAADLARATRPGTPEAPAFVNEYVTWGAGPRASQCLVLAAKARALLDGRAAVSVEDVRAVARPVLRHRVFTSFEADAARVTSEALVGRLLDQVREPEARDLPGAR